MTRQKVPILVFGLLIFCGLSVPSKAQDIDVIRADHKNYISGMGSGVTLKIADQAALAEIIEQISVQVESSFENIKTERDKNLKETVKDVVNTYSNATLTNTGRIILQDEPDARVFRFIKRSEVARIFESRKNKIIELALNGEVALENLQIADALRYFYWSQTLLRSHPESSDIKALCNNKEVLLITWLPFQINHIFSNLSFGVDTVERNQKYANYILNILYKKNRVQNFDYTYWSGQDWSNVVSSKDGTGLVELPVSEAGKVIRLKAEYAFEGEANIDQELHNVMEKLPLVPYKNSYFTVTPIPIVKTAKMLPGETRKVASSDTAAGSGLISVANSNGEISSLISTSENDLAMKSLVRAIRDKKFESVKSLFTEEGFSVFLKLLQYGNAQIIRSFDLKYYPYREYLICRSIPMSFSFKTNNRTFVEDVVFYFNQDHKICNLTFGLSSKALEDITSNDNWSESNRILLISFLENYKTAFSLKRFDYISNIFSDDALIITGLVTRVSSNDNSTYAKSNISRYNRQTKADYLKRLKYSFDSKEFINIRFADNKIRLSGKSNDLFGIQIRQDYFSSNYGDSGYLFLLVDLSDTLKPKIHVRTWQPEKNADGSIYGISDF